MKNWIFLAIGLGFASVGFAQHGDERGGREERGNMSCTDYCTVTGKDQISDLQLITLSSGGTHSKAEADVKRFDTYCSSREHSIADPKNYHWCEKHCLGSGGVVSWWHGRKEQVTKFIDQRRTSCDALWLLIGGDRCDRWCSEKGADSFKMDAVRKLGWDVKRQEGEKAIHPRQEAYDRWCSEQGKEFPGNYHWCKNSCDHLVFSREINNFIDSLRVNCEPIKPNWK